MSETGSLDWSPLKINSNEEEIKELKTKGETELPEPVNEYEFGLDNERVALYDDFYTSELYNRIEGNNIFIGCGLYGDVDIKLADYNNDPYRTPYRTFTFKNGHAAFICKAKVGESAYIACLDSNGKTIFEPVKINYDFGSGSYTYLSINSDKIIFSYERNNSFSIIDLNGNVTEREIDGQLIDYDEKSGYYIVYKLRESLTYYTLDGEPRIIIKN